MEAEVSVEVGAEFGEVSGERVTHRNGYRPRPGETRVGRSSCWSPRSVRVPRTSEAFWSRGAVRSRRSSQWRWRPMSTGEHQKGRLDPRLVAASEPKHTPAAPTSGSGVSRWPARVLPGPARQGHGVLPLTVLVRARRRAGLASPRRASWALPRKSGRRLPSRRCRGERDPFGRGRASDLAVEGHS